MGNRDSMYSSPLISVGLFVYNGERFLAESLQSILNQTFTDFELIISDNASTDRTRLSHIGLPRMGIECFHEGRTTGIRAAILRNSFEDLEWLAYW